MNAGVKPATTYLIEYVVAGFTPAFVLCVKALTSLKHHLDHFIAICQL